MSLKNFFINCILDYIFVIKSNFLLKYLFFFLLYYYDYMVL